MKYPYLIIVYGYEKVHLTAEVAANLLVTKDKPEEQKFSYTRHMVPFVLPFETAYLAKSWVEKNMDEYLDSKKEWIARIAYSFLLSEISTPTYLENIKVSSAKADMEAEMIEVVGSFLDEVFEGTYKSIWEMTSRNKTFRSEDDKANSFVKFMSAVVRKGCEHSLAKHSTVFAGNYTPKLNGIIKKYYEEKVMVKSLSQKG